MLRSNFTPHCGICLFPLPLRHVTWQALGIARPVRQFRSILATGTNMLLIENDILRASINPLGAELSSLVTKDDGAEWLWQGDAQWWSGRAPLLFPVVGRSPDNQVEIDGQLYPMNSHGFARRSTFTLCVQKPDELQLELVADAQSRQSFPFAFRLRLTYRLEGATLITKAEVFNEDTRPMPCQFGYHPAFQWPLPHAAGLPHQVDFDVAPDHLLRLNGDGLIDEAHHPAPANDQSIRLDPADYINDAMVFDNLRASRFTLHAGRARLVMETENLPDFALWQKPNAPFICLEPWHGTAPFPSQGASLAKRSNAMMIPPRDARSFTMRLQPSQS